MSRLLASTLVIAALLHTACTPIEIHVDYEKSTPFASLKQYAWTSLNRDQDLERQVREDLMVRRAVGHLDQALAQRGFKKVPTESADFLVAFTPLVRTQMVTTVTGGGHRGWSHSWAHTQPVSEAGFQVDILDAKQKRVVWSGLAGGGSPAGKDPEDADRWVADRVEKLMRAFPPVR